MAATKIIVTNLASFISALSTASGQDTTCISIELPGPNVLAISSSITLPVSLGNSKKQLIIEGNGVTIQPTTNAGLGAGVPLMSKAFNLANTSYVLRDINFDGLASSTTGLDINFSYDVVVDNCSFNNLQDGLTLRTCGNFTVRNCQAKSISNYGYNFITSIVGSISNTRFEGKNAGNSIGYNFSQSAGISMYDCTSAGSTNKHIVFDSLGNTAINNFSIKNINLGAWTSIGIDLALTTGYVKIDGLSTNFGGTLIKATSYVANTSPNPHLYVENVPYLVNNALFETTNGVVPGCNPPVPSDAVVWSFKEVYTNGIDLFSASRWVGGLIPYYRYSEVFDESKTIVTNYMKVNSNIIS
jgi:hypothetical protein